MASPWLRRTAFGGFLASAMLWVPDGAAGAQTPPTSQPPVDTGASVYQKVLRSTVWIFSERGGGRYATGSGSLVDRGRRLVLTNYHVVGNVRRATVYFPVYENGRAISDRRYYTEKKGRLAIDGEVVELDKQADLALIRLDRVPEGVLEVGVAKASPDPGQSIHSLGNPGRSGALWVYTPGRVRQVYSKKWKAKLDERTTATFEARVIETDSATNPGDSGGPLVNDQGQLVGATEGGAVDAQLLSTFIDVSEIRRLLNRRSVQALRTSAEGAKDPDAPTRDKAVAGKDDGKFFGPDAWKNYQDASERLFKEKKLDYVVETLPAPPKGDVEKVKAMSGTERLKFFREITLGRVKDAKVRGVYVLICKSPPFMFVEMTENCARFGPAGAGQEGPGVAAGRPQGEEVRRRADEGDGPHARGRRPGGEEVTDAAAATGLMLTDDLIFFSRVAATARVHGHSVRQVRTADALMELARQAPPGGVILDLHNETLDLPKLLAGLKSIGPTARGTVAYGSHVEAAVLKAARQAGCDEVLARSRFVRELEGEIANWLTPPIADGERRFGEA